MTTAFPRYHYLDQIRAHMMFLGVVFHSLAAYLKPNPDLPWAFSDPVSHPGLFVLLVMIHLFRMPVFFIVAGFFCALVLQRWGARHLLEDRMKRIALPFLALVIPVHLICHAITDYGAQMVGVPAERERVFDHFTVSYLWFLYFLSIYYALVLVGVCVLPASARSALVHFFRARSLLQLSVLYGVVVALAIWLLNAVFIPAPLKWSVDLRVLLYYGGFFFLGMALYGHPSLASCPPGRLPVLWTVMLLAVGICCALLPVREWFEGTADRLLETFWGLVFAVAAVASSLLVISFYQRYLFRESAVGRYIADSAYWVYLAHFPLAMLLPIWLYHWPVPPTLKFVMVVAAVTALCLISYHFCVRHTWLGGWLNGRKRPRPARQQLALSR